MRRVHRGAFLTPSLSGTLRELEDPRERSLLTDLAYGAVRWHVFLDACLRPRLKAPEALPEDIRHVLRLGAFEILVKGTPRHAAVSEWVDVAKGTQPRLAGLVNAVLRRLEAPEGLPWHERHALPEWLARSLRATFGEEADAAAAGMLQPEPLWLTLHGERARELLAADACEVEEGPVGQSVAVRCPLPLARTRAFREGAVQPQNPASLLPALALAPEPGQRVLDLASGNGIKSAQLAGMGAQVTAVEIDPRKVERARRNLGRLGYEVEHLVADLRSPPAGLQAAERVLLDAPCSGSGTLRGNPEIKLRLQPEDVTSLAELQARLLDGAASLTAPGGTLVYAVCSVLNAEGEGQVARFLERQPGFTPVEWEPPLPFVRAGAGSVTVPTRGIDGFFVAALRRTR